MNKATIILLTIASLGIGSLIGTSLVDRESSPVASADQAKPVSIASTGGAPVLRFFSPDDITVTVERDEFGQVLPFTVGENLIIRDKAWNSETQTIEIPIDGSIEYKAIMTQGDTLVYQWTTDSGLAYYDFHAHDEAFGDEFFTRYDEGEGTGQSGSFVAAYDGQHGWFWLNLTDEPMTITLKVAGYFEKLMKIEIENY